MLYDESVAYTEHLGLILAHGSFLLSIYDA